MVLLQEVSTGEAAYFFVLEPIVYPAIKHDRHSPITVIRPNKLSIGIASFLLIWQRVAQRASPAAITITDMDLPPTVFMVAPCVGIQYHNMDMMSIDAIHMCAILSFYDLTV